MTSLPAHSRRRLANSNVLTSEAAMSASERAQATNAIKREVAEKIRADWEFKWTNQKTVPGTSQSDERGADPPRRIQSGEAARGAETTDLESGEWREREFWSSSPPSPTLSSEEEKSRALHGPFRQDPFTTRLAVSPEELRQEKRRKRQRLIEEELGWNTGLRHWSAQRDAWSGARRRYVQAEPPPPSRPRMSVSKGDSSTPLFQSTNAHHAARRTSHRSSFAVEESVPTTYTVEEVPIPPPLLSPSNILRASITPKAYPQIYSKVVLRSLTPAVPINLADMTRALVDGWKADGQWPPRSTPAAASESQTPVTPATPVIMRSAAALAEQLKPKPGGPQPPATNAGLAPGSPHAQAQAQELMKTTWPVDQPGDGGVAASSVYAARKRLTLPPLPAPVVAGVMDVQNSGREEGSLGDGHPGYDAGSGLGSPLAVRKRPS